MSNGSNLFSQKYSNMKGIPSASCSSVMLNMDLIVENPKNEKIFNMDGIEGLANFMKEVGFYQPITVFQLPNGQYEILTGHRKFRAKKLNGDKTIDAIIRDAPKSEGEKMHLVIGDNMHGRMYKPMDIARSLEELKATWLPEQREAGRTGDTKDILAEELGVSPAKVMRYLRLLTLILPLQNKVDEGIISVHASSVLTQEENTAINGLQEFVNETIDERKKQFELTIVETEDTNDGNNAKKKKGHKDNAFIITKEELSKIVEAYKASKKTSEPDTETGTKSFSKKGFMKATHSVQRYLESTFYNDVEFDEVELEKIKTLKSQLENLINHYDNQSEANSS